MTSPHIGIIGGGIAGATAAMHFSEQGMTVSIFEQGDSLVNGPPICHLHAGGNLYREISEEQCIQLLKESIDTVKRYPHTLNVRPTVIATPKQDKGDPNDLLPRLMLIQKAYHALVEKDPTNQVLGEPSHYFKVYSRQALQALAQLPTPQPHQVNANSLDEWMIPFAKYTDLDTLQYPVLLVQEYGLSVFRLSATVNLTLDRLPNCHVHTKTQVKGVEALGSQWQIEYQTSEKTETMLVDYLINASGYQTGQVDDWVKAPRSRMVEFKAAYVTHWQQGKDLWPEVIFHGERGTPQGMAQLTPYPDGYFQLHGMTEAITLFEDGVAHSTKSSSQPQLPDYLVRKIIHGWSEEEQDLRTQKAIDHMAQFIPSFASATMGSKPLFGAQQIPGDDTNLRTASASFVGKNYARLEIIKASSAIEACHQVEAHMRELGWYVDNSMSVVNAPLNITFEEILSYAEALALQRQYPVALAKIGGITYNNHVLYRD